MDHILIFPLQIEDPSLGPLVVIKFQLKLKNPHVLKWFYLGNFKRKVFQCNLDVQAFQTPRCPQLEWCRFPICFIVFSHSFFCERTNFFKNDVMMEHDDEYSRNKWDKKGLKFNWVSKQMILAIWQNVQLWPVWLISHVDPKW